MIGMENQRKNRIEALEKSLNERYKQEQFENGVFYKIDSKNYFRIDSIAYPDGIVVEHGERNKEAIWYLEDGDVFYLDEMSEDEMLKAIIQEVEQRR